MTIDLLSECSRSYHAWIGTESHVASFGRESLLVFHDMDDIVLTFRIEFFAIGILDPENVSREFDRHDLRAKAYSEIGDFIHSSIFCSHDHPLRSSISKSPRDTDTVESFKELGSLSLDIFCLDEFESNSFLVSKSCCLESFIE